MAANNPSTDADSLRRRRAPAVKDRECPYCHEVYTSSSLGRHLDQFIKEDKPKPPDGKHDVQEIQRLRGGVTRRHGRNSSARRDSHRHDTPSHEPAPASKRPRLNGPDSNFVALNRPNWLTTGVIADVNAEAMAALPSVMTSQYNFDEQQRQFIAERNEGRAAKLALTELVDSIKASLARAADASPFPFEFLAQSFPSLVLLLLPSQPTIRSSQVIPNPNCWPIEPPGEKQLEQLRAIVSQKLEKHQQESESRKKRHSSEDTHSEASSSMEHEAPAPDYQMYGAHLEAAYEAYTSMSSAEKTKLWHLSALRAYTEEQEAHKETYKRLERAEQLLAHQVAQVKRLSSIQQPREYLMNPPTATPLPTSSAEAVVADMVGKRSRDEPAPLLNVDALIAKWKPSVQDNRGFQKTFLSVFEAAARTVARAEGGHDAGASASGAHDDTNGAEENAEGSSRRVHDAWTPNGASHDHSERVRGAGGSRGGEADASDSSGDEAAHADTSSAREPVRSTLASRSIAHEALDPSLRSSGPEATGKDPDESGAEASMEKSGHPVGGGGNGSMRKRGRRL